MYAHRMRSSLHALGSHIETFENRVHPSLCVGGNNEHLLFSHSPDVFQGRVNGHDISFGQFAQTVIVQKDDLVV